ncbi:HNH endonuclease [Leptolyngbya sp. ST-U4]|uniref:HNH endonuclease n=1 Tax=Leptolyngbya sp. ST-U4 TaxID=2933912 RepID=UPI0032981D36
MTPQRVTIELPEPIFRQLLRIAEATQQSIEAIVAQSVMSNLLPSTDTALSELRLELLRMQNLSNEELLQIAQAEAEVSQYNWHTDLLAKSEERLLTLEEQELAALRQAADLTNASQSICVVAITLARTTNSCFAGDASSTVSIPNHLRRQFIEEAGYRCEYCKTSSQLTETPLIMEHIIPQLLDGSDERSNLAASCYPCNELKSAKTHAIDPETGQLVSLFNPRTQSWAEHLTWVNEGTHIIGLTAIGKATVISLKLNNENMVEARSIWIEFGWHPPINF